MTRAVWHAAAADRGRDYRGRHRADLPATSPRFGRAMRIALVVCFAYWAVVAVAAVVVGWVPAVALGAVPVVAGAAHGLASRRKR